MTRADRRKYHVLIKTTCTVTGREFVSIHSTDDFADGHLGTGSKLWWSIERHGRDHHSPKVVEHFGCRKDLIARKKELASSDVQADPLVEKVEKKKRAYKIVDRKHHIIYKTTCITSGNYYIGIHSTDDLNDGYQGSGVHLQRSLKRYGKENHITEVLEHLDDRASLIKREAELVNEDRLKDARCMNLMLGGSAPLYEKEVLKEQARAKISAVAKDMWARRKADPDVLANHIAKLNKPEHIAKRAEAIKAKGHKRTAEQLDRMKTGQSKYYSEQTPEQKLERQRKGTWGRVKTYKIEDAEGNVQLISNLQEFSAKHNIKGTALYKTELRKNFANGFRIIGRA
jgi:hypothetical protein